MIADRNKTSLTHVVTAASRDWLSAHGFKPVETEVCVGRRWIADLGALLIPTQTELIQLRLLRRAPQWSLQGSEAYRLWEQERAALMRYMCCIVEVKTTRSDYRHDHKWTKLIPTDLAFLAVPKGLLSEAEWPVGWGILEWDEVHGIRYRRVATPSAQEADTQRDFVCSLAMRQFNQINYELLRDQEKVRRLERAKELPVARMYDAMRAMQDILTGRYLLHVRDKTPADFVSLVLSCYGIRNLPQSLLTELEAVWGSMKAAE